MVEVVVGVLVLIVDVETLVFLVLVVAVEVVAVDVVAIVFDAVGIVFIVLVVGVEVVAVEVVVGLFEVDVVVGAVVLVIVSVGANVVGAVKMKIYLLEEKSLLRLREQRINIVILAYLFCRLCIWCYSL